MPSSCRVWTVVTPFLLDHLYTLPTSCSVYWTLQRVSSLGTGTHKFDHGLSHLPHEELRWLDVPERIHYKLGVTVHRYLQNNASEYLVDCCTPVSDIPSRRHLRSATRHHLTVPRYRLSTFGRRAFSVAGPTVWNSLPVGASNSFRQSLKTNLFSSLPLNTHS